MQGKKCIDAIPINARHTTRPCRTGRYLSRHVYHATSLHRLRLHRYLRQRRNRFDAGFAPRQHLHAWNLVAVVDSRFPFQDCLHHLERPNMNVFFLQCFEAVLLVVIGGTAQTEGGVTHTYSSVQCWGH